MENVTAKGYDVLCLTDDVDEFALKVMEKYNDKPFKSVADETVELQDENADLSAFVKNVLGDAVAKVKCCSLGANHPCVFPPRANCPSKWKRYSIPCPTAVKFRQTRCWK